MDESGIKQKLQLSDTFVIEELKRVQTLYQLKRIIRYGDVRGADDLTESDAEHIFAMHCLADYFLPLEDPAEKWDRQRIHDMIQYHEIDEILAGDIVSYKKTDADRKREADSIEIVIGGLPDTLQAQVRDILQEYTAQSTPEATFTKAIDKIEPVFHLYGERGKEILRRLNTSQHEHNRIKKPYVDAFPIIKRFADVMNEQFVKEGYYCE